mgnify:CR=1 FL=1|jgi:hypothetical protein
MSCKSTSTNGSGLDSTFFTGIAAGSVIKGIGPITNGLVLQVQEEHRPEQKLLCGKYKVLGGHENLTDIIVKHMPIHPTSIEKMTSQLSGPSARRFEDVLSAVIEQVDSRNLFILNDAIFSTKQWQQIS